MKVKVSLIDHACLQRTLVLVARCMEYCMGIYCAFVLDRKHVYSWLHLHVCSREECLFGKT